MVFLNVQSHTFEGAFVGIQGIVDGGGGGARFGRVKRDNGAIGETGAFAEGGRRWNKKRQMVSVSSCGAGSCRSPGIGFAAHMGTYWRQELGL